MCYTHNHIDKNILFKVKCSLDTKHYCRIKNITINCFILVEAYAKINQTKLGLREKNLNIVKNFDSYEDFLNYQENIEDFNINPEIKLMINSLQNDQCIIDFKNN